MHKKSVFGGTFCATRNSAQKVVLLFAAMSLQKTSPEKKPVRVASSIKTIFKGTRGKVGAFLVATPLYALAYHAIDAWGNIQMIKDNLQSIINFLISGWGTLALMLIGFALLAWQIHRQQNQAQPESETGETETPVIENDVEKRIETLNAQHQSKIEELEREIEALKVEFTFKTAESKGEIERLKDETATQQITASMRENELETYKWLHALADEQAEDISKYIELTESYFCYQELDNPMLRVVFGLNIINKSFFKISIEDRVDGYIDFVGTKLTERPLIINPPIKASPMGKESITIEQRLTRAEAELIRSRSEKPEFAEFDFSALVLTIKISNRFPKIIPRPLTIAGKGSIVKVNQFKIDIDRLRLEFKTERESLVSELNTLTRNHETDTSALERRHEGVLSMMHDRYEAHVKKLKAEIDLLKTQLDERYNPKLKFELYRLIDSKVYLFHIVDTFDPPEIEPVERDHYNINSYFHINLIKEDAQPQILKDIKVSLFRVTRNGKRKEKEIPTELAYVDIHTPEGFASEGRINIGAGLVVDEVGATPYHFEGNVEIKTEYGNRLNKNCFLRFTLIATNQCHYSADIYVDWDEACTDQGTNLLSPKNSVQYRVHKWTE